MNDTKMEVPQVSCNLTAGSDQVKASVASACSMDSGESNVSKFSVTRAGEEDNPPDLVARRGALLGIPSKARRGSLPNLREALEEVDNPFKRRDSLPRTPPKGGFSQTSEEKETTDPITLLSDDDEEVSGKFPANPREIAKNKRRRISTPENERRQEEGGELRVMVGKLVQGAKTMKTLIDANPNTKIQLKKEVVNIGKLIGVMAEKSKGWDTYPGHRSSIPHPEETAREDRMELMEAEIQRLKAEVRDLSKKTREIDDLKEQNQKLRAQAREYTKRLKDMNDLNEENKRLRTELDIPGNVTEAMLKEGEKSWENYKLTTKLNWPRMFYRSAFLAAGPLWEAKSDTDLLLLMESGIGAEQNKEIRKALESRYPEICEDEAERIAAEITTSFKDREGKRTSVSRWILRAKVEEDDRALFDQLIEIQKLMKDGGRSKLAMYPPGNDPQGRDTRRMLEYVFRDSGIECFMHAKHSEERKRDGDSEARHLTRGLTRKSDAFVLRQEGKSYAELLRLVKGTVQPGSEAAKAVKNIRKTRDGGMLILLEETRRENRELLKTEIARVHGGKISERGSEDEVTNFRISEIDGETTKEEVETTLRTVLAGAADELTVIDLKPSFGDNQVATVSVGKEGTPILSSTERIRIGLSSCPVREKVKVIRCYRCWGYGHRRFQCTGEADYSKACARCGERDHLAKECNKNEKCLTCKREGHRAGTGRCPEFRKAVSRERLLKRKKKVY